MDVIAHGANLKLLMQLKTWKYPQFRKYKGIDTWYKILGPDHFLELQRMGESYLKHEVKTDIFPEKMRIQDMLNCENDLWVEVDATAFEAKERLVN
jgi:hypothetical protein